MTLRALLVDDEPLALRRLTLSLAEIEGVEVVDATTSARRAVGLIASLEPDLVFLDIAMPGLNGFDVVDLLESAPAIIFVTAFDAHAVRAFGIDAVDYLLKPVAPDRLRQAVERARAWLAGRAVMNGEDASDAASSPLAVANDLWVHRHQEFVRVPVEGIAWIEAHGDYVKVHSEEGGGLVRTTLSALEAKLDPRKFIRVHRSAICRRDAVTGLRRHATGALSASLDNGDRVPVGRTYSSGLRVLLTRIRDDAGSPS